MEKRLVKIGEAAKLLGCSIDVLRKWEKTGELIPDRKTLGGTRFYDTAKLLSLGDAEAPTLAYARVSSHDQKADLERQKEMLETYCAAKGWRTEIIADLGSGMNFNKRGLRRLLELILHRKTRRLVLTHKDRLLRFGAELVFALCELQNIEIVIIHQGERPSFEVELAEDILEIISAVRQPIPEKPQPVTNLASGSRPDQRRVWALRCCSLTRLSFARPPPKPTTWRGRVDRGGIATTNCSPTSSNRASSGRKRRRISTTSRSFVRRSRGTTKCPAG